MKLNPIAAALLSATFACSVPVAQAATSVLFIGNSFTYGHGSAVRYYRAETVRDLNREGQGGVPALFKSFTQQVGLDYDVAIETRGGTGIDWHVANRLSVITQQPWDVVVAHGFSTLDAKKPGNPEQLVQTALQLAQALQAKNPKADLRLEATFPRADETYGPKGAWYGKTIGDMAKDVRAGYDLAAKVSPVIKGVIPVGEAWVRDGSRRSGQQLLGWHGRGQIEPVDLRQLPRQYSRLLPQRLGGVWRFDFARPPRAGRQRMLGL